MITCTDISMAVVNQLQNSYQVQAIDDECLIITPFMTADAAPVEIYAQHKGNMFLLSDAGETLHQLFVNGVTVESNKALVHQVKLTADIYDVQFAESEMFVVSSYEQLGTAVQRLANAVQAVSYLVYKRSHRTRFRFEDEIEQFLIGHRVTYEPKYSIQGQANNHQIPFYINSSRNVLLEPISATTLTSARRKAKLTAYKWMDLRPRYGQQYKYTVVINDQELRQKKLWADGEARNTLSTYSTSVFDWSSDRVKLLEIVVASIDQAGS